MPLLSGVAGSVRTILLGFRGVLISALVGSAGRFCLSPPAAVRRALPCFGSAVPFPASRSRVRRSRLPVPGFAAPASRSRFPVQAPRCRLPFSPPLPCSSPPPLLDGRTRKGEGCFGDGHCHADSSDSSSGRTRGVTAADRVTSGEPVRLGPHDGASENAPMFDEVTGLISMGRFIVGVASSCVMPLVTRA